jgi:hypothetical protein
MNTFPAGSAVQLTSTFTLASDGSAIIPSTVRLRVRDPTGTEVDYTSGFINPLPGVYSYLLMPLISGIWRYRWEGLGSAIASIERKFEVSPSDFIGS